MVVSSVASSLVGFAGEEAQYSQQKQEYEQNADAARTAAINRYQSQQTRIIQEREAASQKKDQESQKALAARSSARAAASEGGVSGLSVDALLQDFHSQEGQYDSSVDANYEAQESYLNGEMKATQDQAIARINSHPYPSAPSFGAALVNAFGSGMQAYGQSKYMEARYSE